MLPSGKLWKGVALILTIAVASCAYSPKSKPAAIPPELVPPGFTADQCWIDKEAEVTTEGGASGSKVATGGHGLQVRCKATQHLDEQSKSLPVCHTQGGKSLPLSDCCLNEDGSTIPACTPKLQPPE